MAWLSMSSMVPINVLKPKLRRLKFFQLMFQDRILDTWWWGSALKCVRFGKFPNLWWIAPVRRFWPTLRVVRSGDGSIKLIPGENKHWHVDKWKHSLVFVQSNCSMLDSPMVKQMRGFQLIYSHKPKSFVTSKGSTLYLWFVPWNCFAQMRVVWFLWGFSYSSGLWPWALKDASNHLRSFLEWRRSRSKKPEIS